MDNISCGCNSLSIGGHCISVIAVQSIRSNVQKRSMMLYQRHIQICPFIYTMSLPLHFPTSHLPPIPPLLFPHLRHRRPSIRFRLRPKHTKSISPNSSHSSPLLLPSSHPHLSTPKTFPPPQLPTSAIPQKPSYHPLSPNLAKENIHSRRISLKSGPCRSQIRSMLRYLPLPLPRSQHRVLRRRFIN